MPSRKVVLLISGQNIQIDRVPDEKTLSKIEILFEKYSAAFLGMIFYDLRDRPVLRVGRNIHSGAGGRT